MRVLTLNCGTSSLRFDLADSDYGFGEPRRLVRGLIERIGPDAVGHVTFPGKSFDRRMSAGDHGEAFSAAMDLLDETGHGGDFEAIGHRVMHGGPQLRQSTVIDETVFAAIEHASYLAPLHNQAAMKVIRAAEKRFPSVPMVAAFDTAYFLDLPEVATRYALPRELWEELGLRRFGFQGLAHQYMVERYRALHPRLRPCRLITLQLGADCSATASVDGRPLDTSMGFTLVEGLIMATRSGDLDPSIPLQLIRKGGLSPDEVWRLLNTQSGLLALAGGLSDFREVSQRAADGDSQAQLAFEAFCQRVKKYIGAYLALLGGANAFIFGGGIGEGSPQARSRICEGLEWAGVRLDEKWNQQPSTERLISHDDSAMEVWVMQVDEAAVMVPEVVRVLTHAG